MNGQRDIFDQEEPRATPAAPAVHEAVPLFTAPQTIRGQLSAWAETVCDPAPIEADPLATWALEATGDV